MAEESDPSVDITRLLAEWRAGDREAANLLSPLQVVELRFFGGLSVEQTAEALDIPRRTVKRDWRRARIFLHRELSREATR